MVALGRVLADQPPSPTGAILAPDADVDQDRASLASNQPGRVDVMGGTRVCWRDGQAVA